VDLLDNGIICPSKIYQDKGLSLVGISAVGTFKFVVPKKKEELK